MGFAAFLCVLSLAVAAQAVSLDNIAASRTRGWVGAERERSLLQTYNKDLSTNSANSKAKDTPVTRVVNLLKEMQNTLNKEQEEDEALYHKLACWCNNNKYEKTEASDAASKKISDLEATIEMLTARSSELKTKIKELEAEVAADKAALAEATAMREKQLKEFHSMELDDISAIENLKAAIVVLSKHHGAAFPQIPLSLLAVQGKQEPLSEDHLSHSFDDFMMKQNAVPQDAKSSQGFLQDATVIDGAVHSGWSVDDVATVKRAVKSASALLQARRGRYYPSYHAQSGEIFGVLKELKEELAGDLAEAQKTEAARAAAFAELRTAKTSEIENGEKMAETKEDELATTDNDLAEAKEDLGQTQSQLSEDQKFLANLGKTCEEADANFELRKKSRLEEIHAVSETIQILVADEARDSMDTTFSLVQTARNTDERRREAAVVLRQIAAKSHNPELSMLASSVELDAFTKVKAMIDKMIATLKTQQADEVKKNDWCNTELQENDMTTAKTKDRKADLEAKIGELENTIKTLAEEIEKAHLDIQNLKVALQRASENRKQENLDFQEVVADQMVTAEVLSQALDKLATYYDSAALAQTSKQAKKQTPPVPQMEYKKSSGATGVMSMIEKLIYETKEITAESKKSESEAQAAYEALIADTNASVAGLTKEITSKTKAKAAAKKEVTSTSGDLSDTVRELENLAKYNADLHAECDYVTKNFNVRQQARSEEIEALQQAKQILNGANLS